MSLRRRATQAGVAVAKQALDRFGYVAVPARALGAHDDRLAPSTPPPVSPADAAYLRWDNPRLVDLRRRYETLPRAVAVRSVWTADYVEADVDLARFRSHSAYVWAHQELPRATQLAYFVDGEAVRAAAPETLAKLTEDGEFGCLAYDFETIGRVSRDRLDSAMELDFLERHMGALSRPALRVLDIGAGYGRLAHRTSEAATDLAEYVCVDAVPESTFLADFFLRHRGDDRCASVPLDEWITTPREPGRFDLAVNVHSFCECSRQAIGWWVDRLVELEVPRLFLVPNAPTEFRSTEPDRSSLDYLPLLAAAGYRVVGEEPRCPNPDVARLLRRHDRMYLFERT